jgi:hypothetical protein
VTPRSADGCDVKANRRGRRYRSLYTLVALALALGCAKEPSQPEQLSPVQEYGREFFIIRYGDWLGARDASISEANRFCDGRGEKMMPTKVDWPSAGWMSLIFRCLSPDDLESRPDPGTTP